MWRVPNKWRCSLKLRVSSSVVSLLLYYYCHILLWRLQESDWEILFVISACGCSSLGTIGVCNPKDGKCTCKRFVMGARCDRCQVSCALRVLAFHPLLAPLGKLTTNSRQSRACFPAAVVDLLWKWRTRARGPWVWIKMADASARIVDLRIYIVRNIRNI